MQGLNIMARKRMQGRKRIVEVLKSMPVLKPIMALKIMLLQEDL